MPEIVIHLGATALELVAAIAAANTEARVLEFLKYRARPGAATRLGLGNKTRDEMINAATQETLSTLAAELLAHDDGSEGSGLFCLDRAEFIREPTVIRRDLAVDSLVGFSSIVRGVDGIPSHLPLLDLQVPPAPGLPEEIARLGSALGIGHGAILTSGRSYHLYGFSLIGPSAWRDLMARALLLQPFVDTRYVAHRLLSGRAVLRLTSNSLKPELPKVVLVY